MEGNDPLGSILGRAVERGSALAFFAETQGAPSLERRTWEQLQHGASRRAAVLAAGGVRSQEVVLLMSDTSPALVESLLAVLWLGAIPVVLAPRRGREHQQFIRGVIEQTEARRMLAGDSVLQRSRDYLEPFGELLRPMPAEAPDVLPVPPGPAGSTAWLQFSSGSTRVQRGVIVTRTCLARNLKTLAETAGILPGDVFVSWLPLFHDMGLVIGLFGPPAWGGSGILFDPSVFAYRPATWLRLLSDYRGTLSAAPNFAYELCLQRIRDEELEGVRLDSWRYSWNGAEMVIPDTVRRFQTRFSRWGLRPNVIQPGYGAAEATLAITSHPAGTPLVVEVASVDALASGEVRPASPHESSIEIAGVGKPLQGTTLRILDEAGAQLPEMRVGEIEIRGPSICPGYVGAPDPTLASDRWLSGDVGFIANDELFVTGRKKEILIINGRNVYPYDVEAAAVAAAPDIVRRAAAFSVRDPRNGSERVVISLELHRIDTLDDTSRDRVQVAVARASACARVVVHVVPFIPITTSGKVQRVRLREAYEKDTASQK